MCFPPLSTDLLQSFHSIQIKFELCNFVYILFRIFHLNWDIVSQEIIVRQELDVLFLFVQSLEVPPEPCFDGKRNSILLMWIFVGPSMSNKLQWKVWLCTVQSWIISSDNKITWNDFRIEMSVRCITSALIFNARVVFPGTFLQLTYTKVQGT